MPSEPQPTIDVQGHRGARGLRPENTLPSFELAMKLGVTTLELDLHFSADDVVVVWHDAWIDGKKCRIDPAAAAPLPPDPRDPATDPASLRVRALPVAALKKYRCDTNPDPARFPDQTPSPGTRSGDDYGIATLDEVLAFVGDTDVGFNIETKRNPQEPATIGDGFDGGGAARFEQAVVGVVRARGVTSRVTIQSFDPRSLRAVREIDPQLRLAALTESLADPAQLAAAGVAVWSPHFRVLDRHAVLATQRAGLAVIPWTVNDDVDIERVLALGVDGVISDRPDRVLAKLETTPRER